MAGYATIKKRTSPSDAAWNCFSCPLFCLVVQSMATPLHQWLHSLRFCEPVLCISKMCLQPARATEICQQLEWISETWAIYNYDLLWSRMDRSKLTNGLAKLTLHLWNGQSSERSQSQRLFFFCSQETRSCLCWNFCFQIHIRSHVLWYDTKCINVCLYWINFCFRLSFYVINFCFRQSWHISFRRTLQTPNSPCQNKIQLAPKMSKKSFLFQVICLQNFVCCLSWHVSSQSRSEPSLKVSQTNLVKLGENLATFFVTTSATQFVLLGFCLPLALFHCHLTRLCIAATAQDKEGTICENKQMELTCPDGQLIRMVSATYGRQVSAHKLQTVAKNLKIFSHTAVITMIPRFGWGTRGLESWSQSWKIISMVLTVLSGCCVFWSLCVLVTMCSGHQEKTI